jgi:acyl-CoA synthetase (AMP-forming)/AMP-acid ligase II
MDDATYQRLLAKAQRTKDLFTFDDFIRFWAEDRPDRLALEGDDIAFDFAGLENATGRIASALLAMGVAKGDRVCWFGKNSATYFTLFFGAARAGIVMAPIGWRLAEPEAAFIIDNAEAKVLFLGDGFESCAATLGARPGLQHCLTAEAARKLLTDAPRAEFAPSGPDDGVLQLYTSGTTGQPKGVVLSNRNLFGLRKAGLEAPPPHSLWDEDEAVLVAMPCAHIGGTGLGIVALAAGLPGIVLSEFDPPRVFDAVQNRGVTRFFVVPAALAMLLNHPDCAKTDFSRLKYIMYGAAPIPLELLRQCIAMFGAEFTQNYGMTETTGTICVLPPEDHSVEGNQRMRSAGKPVTGVEIEIRDLDGKALPVGEIGEITTRSSANMLHYWKLPEATATTVDAEGWVRTGDIGYLDEDGYVYMYDRAKDMIITGGENVYPAEVESGIYGHPDVLEVAVIGVPDDKWGEAVKAVCVPKPGCEIDPDSIIAYARERLAGFKVPKTIDVIATLPRNPSGKILRRELRAPYWEGRERLIN